VWTIEKTVSKGDYLYAIVRDHPNRTDNNYVLLHRVLMENKLGRLLDSTEVVHHKNHNKKDNRLENLEVMSRSAHAKHHAREMGRKWVDLRCPECGVVFSRQRNKTFLDKPKNTYTACSRSCSGKLVHRRKDPNNPIVTEVLKEYRKYTR